MAKLPGVKYLPISRKVTLDDECSHRTGTVGRDVFVGQRPRKLRPIQTLPQPSAQRWSLQAGQYVFVCQKTGAEFHQPALLKGKARIPLPQAQWATQSRRCPHDQDMTAMD